MPVTRPQVPSQIVARLRAICRALPETRQEAAWVGTRWRVRDKTFAHVLMIADGWPAAYAQAAGTDGPACVATFRTLDRQFDPVDFEARPFFRPVWFPNIVGVVLDAATDWEQMADLLKVSYRVLAPKDAGRHPGRSGAMIAVRDAEPADLKPLAHLWWSGWRDGHEGLLPEALTRLRTLESFEDRMAAALPRVRTLGPVGAPLGFHLIKGDELYQFYLAAEARGTGAAAVLVADAEARLAQAGITVAWLACAIGNARAARFYEKSDWTMARVENVPTETSEGLFPLEVWRYEKQLTYPPTAPLPKSNCSGRALPPPKL